MNNFNFCNSFIGRASAGGKRQSESKSCIMINGMRNKWKT